MIDIDDVDDTDLLIELPRAMRFIDSALAASNNGGVFVHCAAGKSRSVSTVIAYLLWKTPEKFVSSTQRPRKDTAGEAVTNALNWIRRTRPMADPNDGFMVQLHLWWTMGCPQDIEAQPIYQRWLYKREVAENLAVGQAPSRLRFEDEEAAAQNQSSGTASGPSLRCKKCRRMLATSAFVVAHESQPKATCQHLFIEPLSWMRSELQKGDLNGRLTCPNDRCGAAVGRYDWKGFKCSCGAWLTPAFSLQKARVDEEAGAPATARSLGIRMPPGANAGRGGNL